MNKIFASSRDPKEISLVIKGAIVAVAPIMALVIKASGGQIENSELQMIVEGISDIVVAIGSIASLAMMTFGVIRKVVNSFPVSKK